MGTRGLLLALALAAVVSAPARAAGPSPGAASLEDRLDPGLGNGGYDVLHYDLDVRHATSAPSQPIDGTVTIVARATQALSQFNQPSPMSCGRSSRASPPRSTGWRRGSGATRSTPTGR